MPYYVGLDASKLTTHFCVVDHSGQVVERGQVETSPKTIVAALRGQGRRYARIGMESWGMANWLFEGLAKAGLPIICINAVHAHAFLKAQRNKTDRNDASGIAQLMRLGAYKTVHIKSRASQEIRALLTARQVLSDRVVGLQNSIRGLLASFGHKVPAGVRRRFADRVRSLTARDSFLRDLTPSLLEAHAALAQQLAHLNAMALAMARADPICRRLMTAPGVGPIVALEFRSAIDVAGRFPKSRLVGAHLGLTPRTRQSGPNSTSGPISRWGARSVRKVLYLAARSLCAVKARSCWLSDWGRALALRAGHNKAMVAVARRLAVVLHRMWLTETDFLWNTVEAPSLSG